MRSSKSRSRSKPNRNRPSGGNIVNRVFDSSGPEGKVRGTPQQIIDKYNQLARDAQLSNDRVAAENFQQHAEHYLRLLGDAQREMDMRREEQERQNRERQAERDRERTERQEREAAERARDPSNTPQPDVLDLGSNAGPSDNGLVETPENKPKKPGSRSRSRKPAQKTDANAGPAPEAAAKTGSESEPKSGSDPAPKPAARRAPKPAPKAEAEPATPSSSGEAPEAAE